MSGLKGITINTDPAAEAHVYAEDDAAIYQSIFGSDGVLTIGQQCESQVISNNKVRVKDGVIVVGGHIARIPYGDYCDCEIANGQSGKNRNDIIIAKFVSTGTGGIDTMACEVKQGTATTDTATDPVLTQEDLYESGKIREMPLYRVKIEGLSIVGVEPMFDIVPTIPTLNAYLAELSEEELIQDGLSVCTDVHAAVSGGSPKEVMFYRYGKTLNMRLNMHFSASIAQYGVLFRLPSELRPKIPQLFINNNGNVFSINSESGAISPQQLIPSGKWLQISMSYLLS